MKSFIFYFALATLVVNIYAGTKDWPKKEKDRLKKISGECKKISNVSDKEIQDIRQDDKVSDSPEMKKHLGCIAKKVQLVKDDGEIDKDLFCKKLELTNSKDKAKEIVEKCAVKKDNPDETGHHLIKCAIGEDKKFRTASEP